MDKENVNPEAEALKCVECNITFKKTNEKYKHNFNFHQKSVTSQINGIVCEMKQDSQGFYTCANCKEKVKGYEMLQRHYRKQHTMSSLSNSKRKTTEFTFEEGCEQQGVEGKKDKTVHLLKGLGLVPSMISLHNTTENNTYQLFNAIEEEKAKTMNELKLFDKDLTCQLKIYNNNTPSEEMEITP